MYFNFTLLTYQRRALMENKSLIILDHLIYLMNSKIDELSSKALSDKRITREQFYIIELIINEENMTQKKLILKLNKEQTALSRAVKKLVDYGYVNKTQSPYDLRSTILKVTDEGLKVYEELYNYRKEVMSKSLRDLPKDEREQFMKTLHKIYQSYILREPFQF